MCTACSHHISGTVANLEDLNLGDAPKLVLSPLTQDTHHNLRALFSRKAGSIHHTVNIAVRLAEIDGSLVMIPKRYSETEKKRRISLKKSRKNKARPPFVTPMQCSTLLPIVSQPCTSSTLQHCPRSTQRLSTRRAHIELIPAAHPVTVTHKEYAYEIRRQHGDRPGGGGALGTR